MRKLIWFLILSLSDHPSMHGFNGLYSIGYFHSVTSFVFKYLLQQLIHDNSLFFLFLNQESTLGSRYHFLSEHHSIDCMLSDQAYFVVLLVYEGSSNKHT